MIPIVPSVVDVLRDSPSASSFRKLATTQKTDKIIVPAQEVLSSPSVVANRTKSVTFGRVRVKKIRSRSQFSQEEKNTRWYSADEYAAIKKVCIGTLKLFQHNQSSFVDCDEFSSRGLEIRTKLASQTRKENKLFARNAVLEEQDTQELEGIHDPEKIRELYREISVVSQGVAQILATRDREAVLRFQ